MTDKEADALLHAGNERQRMEAERLRKENASLAQETDQIREQNRVLQEVLERRRHLAERLAIVLTEVQEEERALESEVQRVLART